MTRILIEVIVTLFLILVVTSVNAQTNQDSYQGDLISFSVDITAKTEANTDVCIPAGTSLRVVADDIKNDKIRARISRTLRQTITNAKINDCTPNKTEIPPSTTLVIDKTAMLQRNPPNRFGLCYGMLAVPFKYHFTGSKDFVGSGTVGPYLGYSFDRETLGFSYQLVGFAGVSNISVTQSVNGQDSTQNLAGFSYGGGILGKVKGNFQLGVLIGADRVSSNAGYKDNGKPWIAFNIGYSFSQ